MGVGAVMVMTQSRQTNTDSLQLSSRTTQGNSNYEVWTYRFVITVLLGGVLLQTSIMPRNRLVWMGPAACLLAAGLVASLAWAGHAAANADSDAKGLFHLISDVLHLVAAAAWVGALVPFALLLGSSWENHQE